MTTNVHPESAKIYTFPARGRFATGAGQECVSAEASRTPSRAASAALGSAWYHEEAIREAELPRKN